MDDVSAIRNTIVRYGQRIDDRDLEGFLTLYAPDAVHHANGQDHVGHEGITAWLTGAFPRIAHLRHLILGSSIQVDDNGDTASATSDWMTVQRTDDGTPALHSVGRFEDTLAKIDGSWVFTRRTLFRFAGAPPKPAAS